MIDYYTAYYQKVNPLKSGGPLHDLLTFWAVGYEEHFQFVEKPVKIDTSSSDSRGQSIADFRPYLQLANYPVHRIALWFDYHVFINEIVITFKSEPKTN